MTNQRSPMSFREKSAWISLVSLVVVFGTFGSIGTVHLRLSDPDDRLWLMMQAILFSIVFAEAVKFARQIVLYRRDA